MNNSLNLLTILKKPINLKSIRNFHSVQVLYQPRALKHAIKDDVDTSLFFTNLPKRVNEKRVRREKIKVDPRNFGPLVIDCKNKKLNHYAGKLFSKSDDVPLASKGWKSRRSKGDYFIILPSDKYSPFLSKEELPDTFEKIGISPEVIERLEKINVKNPTVIQAKAIVKLLEGENVFIFSECGGGKTVAYLIAMIENILKWKHKVTDNINAPLGIIILPSRELVVQVLGLATSICQDLGIQCQALLSGSSQQMLFNPSMQNVDILICNIIPLCRGLKNEIYSTKNCKHVVVDDIQSFEESDVFRNIETFFKYCWLNFSGLNSLQVTSNSAQVCFASAAVPPTLEEKFSGLLNGHTLETVSSPHLHKILFTVPQKFLRVSKVDLPATLLDTVRKCVDKNIPTLIFSNKQATSRWIALFLKENGVECAEINKIQNPYERLSSFRDFKSGAVKVASSTNLLSLGIHLPQLRHIINYEFPLLMTEYIYRCGRVGRLNQSKDCLVTSFVSAQHEIPLVNKIEKAVRTGSSLPGIYCYRKQYERDFKFP